MLRLRTPRRSQSASGSPLKASPAIRVPTTAGAYPKEYARSAPLELRQHHFLQRRVEIIGHLDFALQQSELLRFRGCGDWAQSRHRLSGFRNNYLGTRRDLLDDPGKMRLGIMNVYYAAHDLAPLN